MTLTHDKVIHLGHSDCTRPHSQWDENSPMGKKKARFCSHITVVKVESQVHGSWPFFVITWMVAVKGMDGTGQSLQFHVSQGKEVD